VALEETEALEVDPTALIGGLVVTIIGGIIVVLVQKWLESREKQRKKDALVPEEVTPPKLPTLKVPNNLPQLGEFIGREREKAEVWEALASRWPLICIDGIGGIGKTALALEAALECLRASKGDIPADDIPTFDAFVWTTAKDRELALSDILDSIARTLDYPYIAQLPPEDKPSEAAKLLRTQRCLLIVDNFETITDDAVRDFLLNLPDPSKALITSREQKLHQARAISLRGMEQGEALTLIRSEGKRLGLSTVEQAEKKVLLRLYEATGGAPLTIKWAVGQMKQRGQSLDTVLDYLYEARGDIFENIFARSWGFLSENARCVLMVMPIFATSASKEAIEAASDVHKWDLDEALGQLVEMWLVEASGELDEAKRRYGIHPLTRAFAGQKLGKDEGWEKESGLRVADYFLNFVRRCYDKEAGTDYQTLNIERENVLAIISWCSESKEWQTAINLGKAISEFLYAYNYWRERIQCGQQVVKAAKQINDIRSMARSLVNDLGWAYYYQNNFEQAKELAEEALQAFKGLSDQQDTASALLLLGAIARGQGDFEKGLELLTQALEVAQGLPGNDSLIADIKSALGVVAFEQGDYDRTEFLWREVRQTRIAMNDGHGIASVTGSLGNVAVEKGDYKEARRLYAESLDMNQQIGREIGIAYDKRGLAMLNEQVSDIPAALVLAQQALDIFERRGTRKQIEETRALLKRLEGRITEARK